MDPLSPELLLSLLPHHSVALFGPGGIGKTFSMHAAKEAWGPRAAYFTCQDGAFLDAPERLLEKARLQVWWSAPTLIEAARARAEWQERLGFSFWGGFSFLLLVDEAQMLSERHEILEALRESLQAPGFRLVLGMHLTGHTLEACRYVLASFGPSLKHVWSTATHRDSPALSWLRFNRYQGNAEGRLSGAHIRRLSEETRADTGRKA